MACCLFGAKSFSKPMLGCCQLIPHFVPQMEYTICFVTKSIERNAKFDDPNDVIESTKTTSMEDVSTGVLEKIKTI